MSYTFRVIFEGVCGFAPDEPANRLVGFDLAGAGRQPLETRSDFVSSPVFAL